MGTKKNGSSPQAGKRRSGSDAQSSTHNVVAFAVVILTLALLVSQLLSTPSPTSTYKSAASKSRTKGPSTVPETPFDDAVVSALSDEAAEAFFVMLDSNHDGRITHMEYFKKARTIVDASVDLTDMWVAEDDNNDGFITRDEFGQSAMRSTGSTGSAAGGVDGSGTPQVTAESIMLQIDLNGDSRVSRKEFDASFAGGVPDESVWTRSDADLDGFVSLDELTYSLEAERHALAQQAAAQTQQGSAEGYGYGYGYGADASTYDNNLPANTREAKVRRRSTGGFGMDDVVIDDDDDATEQQSSHHHQQHQQAHPQVIFDAYDTDEDGRISKEEFFTAEGHSAAAAQGFEQADVNRDDHVSFEELRVVVEMSSSSPAATGIQLDAESEAMRIRGVMDTNGDGYVVLEEIVEAHGDEKLAATMLREADRNGDDRVSLDELAAAIKASQDHDRQQQQQQQHPRGAGDEESNGNPNTDNIFAIIDADADGLISEGEFWATEGENNPQAQQVWDHEDRDGNGFIDWSEFSGPKGDSPPRVTNRQFMAAESSRDGNEGSYGYGDGHGSAANRGGDASAVYMKHSRK